MRQTLADEIDCSSDVDVHDEIEVGEREGVEVSI